MSLLARLKGRFMGPREPDEVDFTKDVNADSDAEPEPEDAFLDQYMEDRIGGGDVDDGYDG